MRRCGDDVLRMLVTGGPPIFGGGGHVPAHCCQFATSVGVANDRCRIVRKHAGHRRQIADVAVDHSEQPNDGGLIGRYRIEIADGRLLPMPLYGGVRVLAR